MNARHLNSYEYGSNPAQITHEILISGLNKKYLEALNANIEQHKKVLRSTEYSCFDSFLQAYGQSSQTVHDDYTENDFLEEIEEKKQELFNLKNVYLYEGFYFIKKHNYITEDFSDISIIKATPGLRQVPESDIRVGTSHMNYPDNPIVCFHPFDKDDYLKCLQLYRYQVSIGINI